MREHTNHCARDLAAVVHRGVSLRACPRIHILSRHIVNDWSSMWQNCSIIHIRAYICLNPVGRTPKLASETTLMSAAFIPEPTSALNSTLGAYTITLICTYLWVVSTAWFQKLWLDVAFAGYSVSVLPKQYGTFDEPGMIKWWSKWWWDRDWTLKFCSTSDAIDISTGPHGHVSLNEWCGERSLDRIAECATRGTRPSSPT